MISLSSLGSTVPKPSPIFNGDLAYEHEFKYIVGIGEVNHYFSGAGIVLNEYWILTCRHVVIQQNINKDTLYFNFTSKGPLHVWPKYYNDIRKTVSEKLPRYSPAKMFCLDVPNDANPQYWTDSDLALIKLQTPLKLYQQDKFNLQRIKFQNKDMFTDFSRGYDVRIAGWGKLFPEQDDMQPTYRLRTAKMANEERWADRNLDFARYPAYRPSRQIPLRFRKNACVGDSGGPAVLTTVGTGEESLMGVMTWVSNPMCK